MNVGWVASRALKSLPFPLLENVDIEGLVSDQALESRALLLRFPRPFGIVWILASVLVPSPAMRSLSDFRMLTRLYRRCSFI